MIHDRQSGTSVSRNRLTLRWLGTTSLVVTDGETTIIVDGFFSRQSILSVGLRKLEPDISRIEVGLKRAGVTEAAAVIVGHAHYDHSMDSPVVSQLTGAPLIGDESIANIGRGWGLNEQSIRVVDSGDMHSFGAFNIKWLASAHAPPGIPNGTVKAPLKPPARFSRYKQGQVWTILINHPAAAMLIQTSAGFIPGALEDVNTDVALISLGTLGRKSVTYRDEYYREIVSATGAHTVIPLHWDNFFEPLGNPVRPNPYDKSRVALDWLRDRVEETEGMKLIVPTAWDETVLPGRQRAKGNQVDSESGEPT
jgi:L-ascorbate metabolism protein UlaG (beta-lactamase superfamily)